MSRRIFLHTGSFTSASNIFTKIIWKKPPPARYSKSVLSADDLTRLVYSLSLYESALPNLSKARGSECLVVLSVEPASKETGNRSKMRAECVYRIKTVTEIRTEKILAEEIPIYEVTAALISHAGNQKLISGKEKELRFTIKPGLSATLLANSALYLPYYSGAQEHEHF